MKVKVCGMRDPDNIRALINLKPDYIGFIFYSDSKRYVNQIDQEIISTIPSFVRKTGVFVNTSFSEIMDKADKYGLDTVQLHGDEHAEFCMNLKNEGLEVIKASGIDENFNFTTLEKYTPYVDHFLFDTKTPLYGGSGKVFDWKLLERYPYEVSYFLSGGISLESLPGIAEIADERLYAVDLNSRFELEPGIKDMNKLEEAIRIIRSQI